MSEEFSFDFNEKTLSNLTRLSLSQSELEERRICELAELAECASDYSRQLSFSGMEILEILSLISDSLVIPRGEIHSSAMSDSLSLLRHYLSTLSSLDKAIFSHLLIDRLSDKGIAVTERDFLSEGNIPETFVYVKNPYADEAYDVFSQEFKEPRVHYCKDFREGLSKVSTGEVGFCLLPFEDQGSRIQSVQELIFKGDFKISLVTPVFGFDGNADMKYCLVSKKYYYPAFSPEDDRYLEIRISRETPLSHLLSVAESYAHEIYRVNSVNINTEDGDKSYYSVLIRDGGGGFLPFLVYILLFTDECTPLGIYKNLE